MFRVALLATVGSFAVNVSSAVAASLYSVTSLPFIPSDLNDRGDIVGERYRFSNGTLTDLTTLPGANNSPLTARAINNFGVVLGDGLTVNRSTTYQATVPNQVFITNGTTISDLGIVGRDFCTDYCAPMRAIDINNAGQLVYSFNLSDYQPYTPSYVQNPDGSRRNLFGGEPASAINEAGQIVGSSYSRGRSGPGQGLLNDGGATTRLSATGYCSPFSDQCRGFSQAILARDINDRGIVVGAGPVAPVRGAPLHGLIWTDPLKNPIGQDLGTFNGVDSTGAIASFANSINNNGEIVGYAFSPNGEQRAVIWQNGVLVDLNDRIPLDSGWRLSSALQVNNQGQIIGTGLIQGQEQGFLLTPEPIPEPSTIAGTIAGIGSLLTLGVIRQKKLRQKKSKSRS